MAKKTAIRCPHCGWEYLTSEIYVPKDFVGDATNIIKDENGDVLGFDGNDMNTSEEYTCDNCGKPFMVDASITFRTMPVKDMFDDGFDEKED